MCGGFLPAWRGRRRSGGRSETEAQAPTCPRRTRSGPWSPFALPLAAWGLQDVLGPPLVAAGAGGPANAGGVLRGVVVASGHHLVRFAYRTPGEMRGRLAAAGGRLDQ